MWFENRYTMTEDLFQECFRHTLCRDFWKTWLINFTVCAGICLIAFVTGHRFLAAIVGAFAGVSLIAAATLPFMTKKQVQDVPMPSDVSYGTEVSVLFAEQIVLIEDGRRTCFDYSQITKAQMFQRFALLVMKTREVIILAQNGFRPGDSVLFWVALRQKCPNLKIERNL